MGPVIQSLVSADIPQTAEPSLPSELAEVERRIEAVWRESSATLDLSGLHLRTVPDSVADLTHVTEIDLSGNWLRELPETLRGMTWVTHLDVSGNRMVALPGWLEG
jgi:Leucine-rich repeat (LRR) protein